MQKEIKAAYTISTLWAAVYFILLAALFVAFMNRSASFWETLPTVGHMAIGQHLSNFALSYFLVASTGVINVVMYGTASLKRVYAIAGTVAVANIIYELLLPLLNTRDVIDMWYGLVGTGLGVLVVWLIAHFGLRPKKA